MTGKKGRAFDSVFRRGMQDSVREKPVFSTWSSTLIYICLLIFLPITTPNF